MESLSLIVLLFDSAIILIIIIVMHRELGKVNQKLDDIQKSLEKDTEQ